MDVVGSGRGTGGPGGCIQIGDLEIELLEQVLDVRLGAHPGAEEPHHRLALRQIGVQQIWTNLSGAVM